MNRAAVLITAIALVAASCSAEPDSAVQDQFAGEKASGATSDTAATATLPTTTTVTPATTQAPDTTTASTLPAPDTTLTEVVEEFEFGTVSVSGTPLTRNGEEQDRSLGVVVPNVVGADFEGNEVGIVNDGQAKMIVFLAHWCPHCQNEVPEVRDWLGGYDLPEGVAIYSVATGMDPTRDNYPPSAWLEREDWSVPVILDDAENTAARTFGLNAYPYWVFIYSDGTLAARVTGGLPIDVLTNAAEVLAEGNPNI